MREEKGGEEGIKRVVEWGYLPPKDVLVSLLALEAEFC